MNYRMVKKSPAETSKTFLCSYLSSIRNAANLTTEQIIRGKSPLEGALHPVVPPDTPWQPPPPGWLALSVDGSYSAEEGSAGAGMILRENLGSVIFSSCQLLFYCNNVLEAEIQAIKSGMSMAIEWSNLPVLVQSDSMVALSSMTDASLDKSANGQLVRDIKNYMLQREFKPVKIVRSQKMVSHCLANYARTAHSTVCWLQRPPPFIHNLVLADCKPVTLE
ncbi:unnamed protein product [Triticum aestivum]|uniref:RNase H type-1 domain-containing protein n=1 Tax=Triticum aestivum TaxID=4565 RepID=A0A7H4LC92_WHEAT|nr:unnamed protein product [Triticum aestivum]